MFNPRELAAKALSARNRAYAPYSKFKVGAAVLASSGKIYTGCNVENASYGLTICAERVAVFNAALAGERKLEAVAVATACTIPASPCGACRQVLREFGRDMKVVLVNTKGRLKMRRLSDLLPDSFGPEALK